MPHTAILNAITVFAGPNLLRILATFPCPPTYRRAAVCSALQ